MRSFAYVMLVLAAACSVDDKKPGTGDDDDGPGSTDDGIKPETSIDSAPGEFGNQGQVSFEFSSDKSDATFTCMIDTEDMAPCTSPYTRKLEDGTHEFSVRATDPFGNADDTPAEAVFTIDTKAPNTTIGTAPPHADNSTSAMFEFTSDEDNVTFECALDGGAFAECTSGQTFQPITDGAHSFSARAIDRAGNADATPAVYAWNVDTSTPDTKIVTGPAGAVADTNATFTFNSPDAGGGATFDCNLDGTGFLPCTSPHNLTLLAEGAHTFRVRVRDLVGNLDPTPAVRAWTVDLTAPDTTITGGPSGTVAIASASFTFTSSEPNSSFKCNLDNAGFAPCTSPFTAQGLAQGDHTFAVAATDAAGHPDASPATASWTVDTVAPSITITSGPASGSTSGPRVAFAFTADGAAACSFDGGAFAPCTSPVAINLNANPHTFSVRADDGAGNSGVVTRTWTVACAAPDPAGAAGALHLDDAGQSEANGTGGPAATLGDTPAPEPTDPTVTAGRFGQALAFTAAANQHVTWAPAIAPTPAMTVELWAKPASAGDLFVSGDGRVAIRAGAGGGSITATLGDAPAAAISAAIAAGSWHHILLSFAEPDLHLYVDGVRTDVGNIHPTAAYAFDAVRLGGAYGGAIDEVWMSTSATTDDETALGRYCPL